MKWVLGFILLGPFVFIAVVTGWSIVFSMSCWMWYGDHTTQWLFQHCG